MPRRRYDYCESCVNADIPYECRNCRDGSRFEGIDLVEELTVHELRFMTIPNEGDE